MNIKVIKKDLNEFLAGKDLHLFEVKYFKSEQTLSVVLDDKIEMDELEVVSNEISKILDKYEDDFDANYILDVTTVGIERPIRSEEELIKAIGEYIYVKTKDDEVYGYLRKYENGVLSIDYKQKNIDKIKNVEYAKVKKMRYAVKF